MARGPGSIKGGLTWNVGMVYDPEGRKKMRSRKQTEADLYGEDLLGGTLAPSKASQLSEKFILPPFTVLNAREGWWQERKRMWLALGIRSELGRGEDITYGSSPEITQQGPIHYRNKEKAAPGGSKMPAMNYKDRQRGSGSGKAVAGTEAVSAPPAPIAPPPAPTVPAGRSLPWGGDMAPVLAASGAAVPPQTCTLPDRQALLADQGAKKRFSMPTVTQDVPKAKAEPRKAAVGFDAAPLPTPFNLPTSTWTPPTELPRLIGARRISIDVETRDPEIKELGCGARRPGCHVVGIAIGRDDGGRWYLPFRHQGGDNLDEGVVLRWARDELNGFDGEVVGANLSYDLDFMANEQVTFDKVRRFRDVQLAEPLLDSNRLSYSLDALAKDYLNTGKDEALLHDAARAYGVDPKGGLWRLPARFVGAYAEADADLPLRVLALQEKRLADEGLEQVFDVESRLIPVLVAMRRRGVRVDLAKTERVRERLEQERDKWLGVVRRYTGPRGELMAAESLAPALEARGIHVPMTPKTKKPSITSALFHDHKGDPLVDAIAAGRRVSTLLNTFIDGHILGHHINGRVHCTFNQLRSDDTGAITGRFSSSSPNLQNIPSRKNDMDDVMQLGEDVVQLIRGQFVPDEGEEWVRHDYSQIEYRLATHFGHGPGSDKAREAYCTDPKTDFHKLCARMAGLDPDDKNVRKSIKGVNFCKLYGGGVPKIAAVLGVSLEEAEKFVGTYDAELPWVKKTLEAAMQRASERGYVTTIAGRRQRFDLWEPAAYGDRRPALPRKLAEERYGRALKRAKTYAALNYACQGSSAEITKKAMVDAWEAGLCAPDALGAFLLTVHDELDNSVAKTARAQEAKAELKRVMENAYQLSVPVIAEATYGADWGEC